MEGLKQDYLKMIFTQRVRMTQLRVSGRKGTILRLTFKHKETIFATSV